MEIFNSVYHQFQITMDQIISDDIKGEDDIDNGKSKIDVVNEERISVDAYSTNEKEDLN